MFESAELGHKVDKSAYARRAPEQRQALLDVQYAVMEKAAFPVVILVSGVDGAGKGETVNLLNTWMDPRYINTHGMGVPTDEERMRPPMWRFWRRLPPKGRIGVFFGSWYTEPINGRVLGKWTETDLEAATERIVRFERMLVNEGALVIKFWFHLSKKAQKARLTALEATPRTRWRVTREDWYRFGYYDDFREVSEHVLRETSTAQAPWIVVEGSDERYRSLTVTHHLLTAIKQRLKHLESVERRVSAPPLEAPIDNLRILDALDLTQKLNRKAYEKSLEDWQGRLTRTARRKRFQKHAVVVVFEGMDAAGKGSTIRRITQALDARLYDIHPIAAPTDEERAQPYLWRFWRHLPRRGKFAIFDRSWYGRVLVERVEGLCDEAAWMRAYREINDFEEQIAEAGIVLVKFWLAIGPDEQLMRFEAREQTPFKRFKITPEDWRNRGNWDAYIHAASDMIERTSTDIAPWTLVEAEDKHYARVKVMRTLTEAIEARL